MTYRGHVKNGVVVLDPPAQLPEGASIEVNVVAPADKRHPPITSLEHLQSGLPGDPLDGADPAELLRELRSRPWRASSQEPLE